MTYEEKLIIHRSRRPRMIQVAKEFAAELDQVCKKYNSQLNGYYTFCIGHSDGNDEAIVFNTVNGLRLLDLFYPDGKQPRINLNSPE